jgi:hypothetical protein
VIGDWRRKTSALCGLVALGLCAAGALQLGHCGCEDPTSWNVRDYSVVNYNLYSVMNCAGLTSCNVWAAKVTATAKVVGCGRDHHYGCRHPSRSCQLQSVQCIGLDPNHPIKPVRPSISAVTVFMALCLHLATVCIYTKYTLHPAHNSGVQSFVHLNFNLCGTVRARHPLLIMTTARACLCCLHV